MIHKNKLLPLLLLLFCTSFTYAKQKTTIPINIGLGIGFNHYNGLIGDDQLFHGALKIDLHAIIDKQTIKQNKKKIPKQYRKMAMKLDEVHIKKWWIPNEIIISPKIHNTSIYGINFRPIGTNIILSKAKPIKFIIGAGLNLTYLNINSSTLFEADSSDDKTMHFFRPGIDINPDFKIKFTKKFNISLGAKSMFYIPQTVSSTDGIFGVGGFNENSLWNMNQLYIMFNLIIPYKTYL